MRVIDLTMKISPSIRVFPGSPQPSFVRWSRFETHGYDSEVMFMSTHTGTHMDAPSHVSPSSPAIDEIAARRFVCNALLVKVSKRANQKIGLQDVAGERISEGDTVVFSTGWEKRVASRNYMTENPGLGRDAARYLVKKKVNAVAIDGPSIDAGADAKFTIHNTLLPAGVLVVENLCNLGSIRRKRFRLVVSPLKLAGASGSPVRAIAII